MTTRLARLIAINEEAKRLVESLHTINSGASVSFEGNRIIISTANSGVVSLTPEAAVATAKAILKFCEEEVREGTT